MAEIDEGLPRSGPDGGIKSILTPETRKVTSDDPVRRVLKWVLLGTAIICFALIAWATQLTYRDAPMQPDRFVVQDGTVVMSGDDIIAGKSGFQKADLDYGSLYGMGSYFGPDYMAENLVALATVTRENLAQAGAGRSFASIEVAQQAAITLNMQAQLHGVDLDPEGCHRSRRPSTSHHDGARRYRHEAAAGQLCSGASAKLAASTLKPRGRQRIS